MDEAIVCLRIHHSLNKYYAKVVTWRGVNNIKFLNWDYISGFFDADGYLTVAVNKAGMPKIPILGFTNCKLEILESIQSFVESETGIRGYISKKKPKTPNGNIGYDLKYARFPKVLSVFQRMKTSIHPKKQARFKVLLEIAKINPRNGHYTQDMLDDRAVLEDKFLEIM